MAAADFTVTNTNNYGPGSLYQAITDANNTPGADRILFNIPGSGVQKIDVSKNLLPTISESLVIDGYSQPGAKPNTLTVGDNAVILIQVDGGGGFVSPCQGFVFSGSTSKYVVRGLSITGFCTALNAGVVDSAVVAGNFIGVLPDGETARPNGNGVMTVTQLGGIDPASRNVISGNNTGFWGASPDTPIATVVEGNYVGTNASGTKAVPNSFGIAFTNFGATCASKDNDLSKSIIGGTAPGAGNLISGNAVAIDLGHGSCRMRANGLRIQGNVIGLQADGTSSLPNKRGIFIEGGSDNVIGGLEPGAGNVIAFSDVGVPILNVTSPTVRNRILSNAIYANRVGIDLNFDGPTPNDPGDPDAGTNNLQNKPVIESAVIANGSVTIKGTLNSSANSQFMLQYFAESLRLGQIYLGSSSVTTDAGGNAQFSATFPVSDPTASFNMTATSQDGNTSEFAQNPRRLKNISTRELVEGGDHVAIAGFIMPGPPKQLGQVGRVVVFRAIGPSLQGINAPLSDPTLEVYNPSGFRIAKNDNWRDDSHAQFIQGQGLAPAHELESATATDVGGGNYTVVVRGNGAAPGIALVEVYDVDAYAGAELPNMSTRGFVGTGDNVMIAGTILEQGDGFSRIVARALGPSLATAGITDPLANPMLELHDSQGATIASNDDWRDGQPEALLELGLAPTKESEAAVLLRLPSGAYTAIIRGKDNTTGVGLVEIYNLH
ncbi:MAG: large repetitive protein [Verrucomicrobiota bacterium]